MICDNKRKSILNTFQVMLTQTLQNSQNRVIIVQATTNQDIWSKDTHFLSKIPSNSMKVMHLEETGFTCLLYMFCERKVSIELHT